MPDEHSEPEPVENAPRLADLTVLESGTEDERAQQYSEWADRLKQKRQKAKSMIEDDGSGSDGEGDGFGHWNPDAVFAESRRLEEAEAYDRPNPGRVAELLAVLKLSPDATPAQVGDAYRSLAKRHHPDRFVTADEATQQEHADRMADINRAYRALKKIDRA